MTTDPRAQIANLNPTIGDPLVSLIVVTYNSAELLPAFFAALATTTYARYEVLVVDNASHDGTPDLLTQRYPQARLLPNAENLGFGRACNQGARAARGDLLVFLNPDVIVTPDWLAILVRRAAEHPDAAIICPTTLYPGQPPAPAAAVEEVAAVPGCAMLMPRAAWQDLGGFDERIFLYWEDTELCWRAWLLGRRVLNDLEAIVYHERGGSGGGQRWDAEQTKNGLYTYLKLMRWRRTLPFAALLAAKTLAKLALRRQPGLLEAWRWNWRRLGETLARRRELRREGRGDPAALERLVQVHTRRMRHARAMRRRPPRAAARHTDGVATPCPVCGRAAWRFVFAARDRMHQIPGEFALARCACGLRATLPQPEDIGRYYPATYYSYGPLGALPFYGSGFKGALRTLVLRYQYGYRYGELGARLPERGLVSAALRMLTRPLRRRDAMVFGPGPLPAATPGGRALDIGSGNGIWLLKLQALGWQVEGLEFSSLACQHARAAGLTVHQGSLADIRFPSGHFDVVRIWQTLEHVPNPAEVLREIARILKPGGQLLIGVPNAGGWLARAWGPLWFDLDVPRHLWHFTAADLRALVERAGLRVDSIGYGFYGGYTLLRCFRYWFEETRGYSPAGRAAFERRWDWVRRARAAWVLRLLLRLLERTNYLELAAARV
jgi:GT2 family glycosyltransferase/SAM-dependent methyltransferase